jgi:AP2-associated kinase
LSNNGFRGLSDTEIQNSGKIKAQQPQPKPKCEKDPFNSFVADFDTHNLNIAVGKASELELEVSSLKEQLKKTTLEKAEMTAKYEKLSAICRSQRQEIQELKCTLAEATPPSNKVSSRTQESGSQVIDLHQCLMHHISLSLSLLTSYIRSIIHAAKGKDPRNCVGA